MLNVESTIEAGSGTGADRRTVTTGRVASIAATVVLTLVAASCGDRNGPASTESGTQKAMKTDLNNVLPVSKDLNVIVVSFDAMRPDVLSPYGGDPDATPNIEDFASRSVVFDHAYTVAPVTPTSFSAFFSGMLPTSVFHAWHFDAETTLAGELSDAGYLTAGFINNVWLGPERGFNRGYDLYDWRRNDPDEVFIKDLLAWIEKNQDQRFFVWTHFLHPHAPYRVVPGAEHLYSDGEFGRFGETTGNTFDTTDEHEIARIRELYLGEVWSADRLFGELINHLRSLGLLQSSIVVLTADHGEEFGEHGGFQHGRLYEEHLRIPLIVHHPRGVPGRVADLRIRSIDLMPTLLHLVGHPLGKELAGEDLYRLSGRPWPPVVGISMTGAKERWASILDGSYKLIVACGQDRQIELFDLGADPEEQVNLADVDRDDVVELFQELGAQMGGAPCEAMKRAAQGIDHTEGMDSESLEALRALGYID